MAAERFSWSRRNPEPRSMRDGRLLIGWGMATATYPMNLAPASARARLLPDGTVEVASAASDMGPGTWTSMTQVAADALGLPIERVTFILGDSRLPKTPRHADAADHAAGALAAARFRIDDPASAIGPHDAPDARLPKVRIDRDFHEHSTEGMHRKALVFVARFHGTRCRSTPMRRR